MAEERDEANTISTPKLYAIMLAMLFFGTCNTIVMKAQDQTVVGKQINPTTGKEEDRVFTHPYFQCANMFLGEMTCLAVYFLKLAFYGSPNKKIDEGVPLSPGGKAAQESKLKTSINPVLLAIPASCDFCGSTLMFVALTQCAASVYQMMRGIIVFITAGMSIAFLGGKQYAHHWISLSMIVLGVAIVGIVSVEDSKKSADGQATTTITGVLLLLLAQVFTGCQFISEEKLLSGYYLDPFLVVGLEGFWGSMIYSIVLPVFQTVHDCDSALCHDGHLENTIAAFKEFGEYPVLIMYSCFIIVSIASFNATGVAITKYATAAQRSTVDTSRTLLIWIFSLILGWEEFLGWELVGFVLLVMGTLIYNEIYVVPIGFMKYNTREEMKNREALEEKAGVDDLLNDDKLNYISSSPHAAYDANRNKRQIKAAQGDKQRLRSDADGEMLLKTDE